VVSQRINNNIQGGLKKALGTQKNALCVWQYNQ